MLGEAFIHLGTQAFDNALFAKRLVAANLIAVDEHGGRGVIGEFQAFTDGSSLDADLRKEPFEIQSLDAATDGVPLEGIPNLDADEVQKFVLPHVRLPAPFDLDDGLCCLE